MVPRPIRAADLALFRAVARSHLPVLDETLPRLSRAANHSRLWMAIALLSAATGGRFGRRAAARGLLGIAVTSALTNLPAKLLTGRTRPDLSVVPEVRRLARVPSSTSFPSGHSASAFAFATGVSMEQPRLRLPLFALATAVATSRVYTGVHYPGDVVVGAAIGAAVGRATVRPWPLADPRPATAATELRGSSLVGPEGDGLVVVDNVTAGTGPAEGPLEELRRHLPAMRTIEHTPGGDLVATLRQAASEARVLGIAGGDGSVSAAATVAHAAGVPLAIVAGGTRDHLAKDLGLERAEATARAASTGRVIRVDLATADDHLYVNAASIGAYPHLVVTRERLERRIGKWSAALWGVLRTLRRARPEEVEIDGRARRVWLLFVGNCRFEEHGFPATRRARLDDGTLDVRILDAEPRWARTRVAVSLLLGRIDGCRAYERWTAPELRVRSRGGQLRVAADGETLPETDEVRFGKRPGALLILQPAGPDR